jgi:hypothetical protein
LYVLLSLALFIDVTKTVPPKFTDLACPRHVHGGPVFATPGNAAQRQERLPITDQCHDEPSRVVANHARCKRLLVLRGILSCAGSTYKDCVLLLK